MGATHAAATPATGSARRTTAAACLARISDARARAARRPYLTRPTPYALLADAAHPLLQLVRCKDVAGTM